VVFSTEATLNTTALAHGEHLLLTRGKLQRVKNYEQGSVQDTTIYHFLIDLQLLLLLVQASFTCLFCIVRIVYFASL
jgi:hypothetical protein